MLARVLNLTAMPDTFAAGTTVKYTRTLTDYPANAGWTLTVTVSGWARVVQAAAPSGTDHLVTLASAATATLIPAGLYRWQERVSNGTDTFQVGVGSVFVTANVAVGDTNDSVTMDEKLLVAIDAVLAGKITDDVLQYSIAGRGLTMMSRLELYELRQRIARNVARARRMGKPGRRRRVTFTGTRNET